MITLLLLWLYNDDTEQHEITKAVFLFFVCVYVFIEFCCCRFSPFVVVVVVVVLCVCACVCACVHVCV